MHRYDGVVVRSQMGIQIHKAMFVYLRGFGEFGRAFQQVVEMIGCDGHLIQVMIIAEIDIQWQGINLIKVYQLL